MSEEIQDVATGLSTATDSSSVGQDEGAPPSSANVNNEKEENLPFHTHPRWQEMIKERNSFREAATKHEKQAQEYQEKLYNNIEAIKFYNQLRQDPRKMQAVAEIIMRQEQQAAQTPKNDPYSEYDPVIAAKLRKIDELEQNYSKSNQEREVEREQYAVQQNEQNLERIFEQKIADAKISSKEQQQAVAQFTIVALQRLMPGQDIRRANQETLEHAFREGIQTLDAVRKAERAGLSVPNVPASGSKNGVPTRQETWGNAAERISDMARELGA